MQENLKRDIQLSALQTKIVVTLVYFDLFKFPLTIEEIVKFSKISSNQKDNIQKELDELLTLNIVFPHGKYYSLIQAESLEARREDGQKYAQSLMTKARKYSNIINSFPYVRSICISGSLSKGCVDEYGDIDYFIITEPQRLWVTRTLLIAFKKIFLLNRHKYFCVNYFVDTNHLEIPDKNIFTATELLTLIPMTGLDYYSKLMESNDWAHSYLPNLGVLKESEIPTKSNHTKKWMEHALSGSFGDKLDTLFMNLTIKKWKSKFKNLNEEALDNAMRSRKYVSKHHPQQFQQLVLNKFNSNIALMEAKLKFNWHD
jgi:hypothetical protein